jgi:hypothetical protein
MTSTLLKSPLMKRFMKWLLPEQRVANRHSMPPLVAYLGMMRSSKQYQIGDVSVAGFYMMTEERWLPGTGFPVTLERTDAIGNGAVLSVYVTVVRIGIDGVALKFVLTTDEKREIAKEQGLELDLTKLARFLRGLPLSEASSERYDRAS